MKQILIPLVLLLAFPVLAQESTSYRLREHTFNSGGHPSGGLVLVSTSYKISLDTVGDSVAGRNLASTSYHMDGSFAVGYPPPGEVLGLRFTDSRTLVWKPEKSTGVYNLYRDLMSNLSGLGYGQCEQQDLTDETTTDTDEPQAGDGYFYLVTAENRLDEEGAKGQDSDDIEREGTACP